VASWSRLQSGKYMTRQSRSIRHSPWHEDYQHYLSILEECPDEVFCGQGASTNKEIGEVFGVAYTAVAGTILRTEKQIRKTWRSNDMRRRSLKRCNNMTYEGAPLLSERRKA